MNLSQLLQMVMAEMGQLQYSKATGGSTTTVVDTDMKNRHGAPDVWNYGTIFIVRDGGGSGAAPEGEFSEITDYADDSGTWTINTLTTAVASGDRYAFASSEYPLQLMIEIVNNALQMDELLLPFFDRTTVDTASEQREYSGAVAWQHPRPQIVEIQRKTGNSNDNQWDPIYQWDYEPASSAGSAGKIIFRDQPETGRDIRVGYYDYHAEVNDYDDTIDPRIPRSVIKWAVCLHAYRYKRRMSGDELEEDIKYAQAQLNNALITPPLMPKLNAPAGKILEISRNS